ncbi:NAD(P)-binding protein [Aureobasidium pullulans]|uniref:NAD(P)-binding protein n=1 Tax=Aureobasidium pullulans TaxID=5580 RepID=A0A4S9KTW7_AURPU|nr:NAD(P)-binding protein [Aureobasidium pullulans]
MSRYAAAFANPAGPGDARPTALQIVKDEGAKGKLAGKVIVITGTSSGLGIETARALAQTGARLILTARDLEKAKTALESILEPGRVDLVAMDNTSLESVRAAAKEVLKISGNQVNILINNAGIMALPDLQHTKDGFEMQFGVNHLAHFLFFELLKPALLASATTECSSRVVNLSSSGHRISSINESDNYNFEKGGYHGWVAYGQSKTANVYMTNEIERRYGSFGLHANAVHPGLIGTPLMKHVDADVLDGWAQNEAIGRLMKSVEQGAATTVWAAVGKEWEHKGGKYLAECEVAPLGEDDHKAESFGHVPHTYDPEREARLWEDSLKMVGLEDN